MALVRKYNPGDDLVEEWDESVCDGEEEEWPLVVRERAVEMIREGRSVRKEVVGLCEEEVPRSRRVLAESGDGFVQLFP
ncbi:hypothetical protein HDV00_005718 [Rhizophlyctis rosea]|nr:hypothetical protein HDV00_005718 [Rhizophlyctis rosea]